MLKQIHYCIVEKLLTVDGDWLQGDLKPIAVLTAETIFDFALAIQLPVNLAI